MSRTGRPKENVESRFWKYVERDGKADHECWNWKGSTNFGRYGKFYDGEKSVSAHRYIWELTRKCKVPEGKMVLHLCDNHLCCNPNHLYCGTPKDNMKDRFERDRVNFASFAEPRLYEGEIWLMKKLYKAGISQLCIAMMFKVDQSTVSNWLNNKYRFCKSLDGGVIECPK
jgi:hypothetical protein